MSVLTDLLIIYCVLPDVYTELEKIAHMQYFSFRSFVSGLHANTNTGEGEGDNSIKLLTVNYVVANAHAVSYPQAW